ncbi:hypothetical protein BC629DRAFT_1445420 [Irpex lacteus]|nr:hypothetical protein BC629DRAFT_1445420 [Irpex lacteus]
MNTLPHALEMVHRRDLPLSLGSRLASIHVHARQNANTPCMRNETTTTTPTTRHHIVELEIDDDDGAVAMAATHTRYSIEGRGKDVEETGVRDGGGWTDGLVAVCHASGSTRGLFGFGGEGVGEGEGVRNHSNLVNTSTSTSPHRSPALLTNPSPSSSPTPEPHNGTTPAYLTPHTSPSPLHPPSPILLKPWKAYSWMTERKEGRPVFSSRGGFTVPMHLAIQGSRLSLLAGAPKARRPAGMGALCDHRRHIDVIPKISSTYQGFRYHFASRKSSQDTVFVSLFRLFAMSPAFSHDCGRNVLSIRTNIPAIPSFLAKVLRILPLFLSPFPLYLLIPRKGSQDIAPNPFS